MGKELQNTHKVSSREDNEADKNTGCCHIKHKAPGTKQNHHSNIRVEE